jgi:hypothetical protein
MKAPKIIFDSLIALLSCLSAAGPIFCQTETLDIVHYTPPPGWSKTVKQGAVVYTDANQAKGTFAC